MIAGHDTGERHAKDWPRIDLVMFCECVGISAAPLGWAVGTHTFMTWPLVIGVYWPLAECSLETGSQWPYGVPCPVLDELSIVETAQYAECDPFTTTPAYINL